MEVSGQLHTPPLYPWGKSLQYPFDRRLGGTRAGLNMVVKSKNPIIVSARN
jgi:hypothetical protein